MMEYIFSFIGFVFFVGVAFVQWGKVRKANKNKLPAGFEKQKHKEIVLGKEEDILRDRYLEKKLEDEYDCIVIGSGMSGLTCGSLLSKLGQKVLVLEKHYVAGGMTHTFLEKGYEFDVGVHYLGNLGPEGKDRKYYDMICQADDRIDFHQLGDKTGKVYDKMVIRDRTQGGDIRKEVDYRAGDKEYLEGLYQAFPEEKKAIDQFLVLEQKCRANFSAIMTKRMVGGWFGWLLWWKGQQELERLDRTAYEVLSEITSNQDLIMALTYLWGDLGQSPKQISFLTLCCVTYHYRQGGYYPVGGSSVLAKKIVRSINKCGGRVLVGEGVKEIVVHKQTVCGVRMANGKYIKSRTVISSANFFNTFTHLLPTPAVIQRMQGLNYDPASLVLFVGLKANKEQLGVQDYNIWQFNSNDCDKDIDEYVELEGKANQGFPVMFIGSGSAKDPLWDTQYKNKTTLEVITFAKRTWWEQWDHQKCTSRDPEYEQKKQQLIDKLLEEGIYKNYPKCRGQVEQVDLGTPLTCEHYLQVHNGSIYGISNTPARLNKAYDDLLVPRTQVHGLFMTGQDITGAGVISALQSGICTVNTMQGYFNTSSLLLNHSLNNHIANIDALHSNQKKTL